MHMYGYDCDGVIKFSDIVIHGIIDKNVPNPNKIEARISKFKKFNTVKPLKMTQSGIVVDSIITALVLYSQGILTIPYVYVSNTMYSNGISVSNIRDKKKFINSRMLTEFINDQCKSARKEDIENMFKFHDDMEEYIRNRREYSRGKYNDINMIHLLKSQDGKCYICGREMTLDYRNRYEYEYATVDHIIPSSKGGLDDMSNNGLCCYRCNQLKADMEFTEQLKKYIIDKRNQEKADGIEHTRELF